jgi:tRNA 2-thiocytidine biosynthesis protein TtcA
MFDPAGGFRGENLGVFFRFERAGGVDQQSARLEGGEGVAQDSALAGGVAGDFLGHEAPLDFGVAAERARAGAGGIDQDPVEHRPEGQRLGGIELEASGGPGFKQEAAQTAGAGIAGDGEEAGGFQGEGGFVAGGGAEVEESLTGAEVQKGDDSLSTDVHDAQAGRRSGGGQEAAGQAGGFEVGRRFESGGDADIAGRRLEGGFGGGEGGFATELALPAGQQPDGQAGPEFVRRPGAGQRWQTAQDSVRETRGRTFPGLFDEFDRLAHGGVGRDPVEEPELVGAKLKGKPDRQVQRRRGAGRPLVEEEMQLGAAPQNAEDQFRSEAGIAGIKGGGSLRKQGGGQPASLHRRQNFEGGAAGRAHDSYNRGLDLQKTILRKVGEAIGRFNMIRDGDRVAVGFSGGKDSFTLLEALLLLRERAPIDFTVCAFTIEQGKFLKPVAPFGEYLKERGVDWTYRVDDPSLRLLSEQPDHGCDLCSRFRRRAVYEVARDLGANVVAFGHTADDFCEAFLRNAMFTGKLSALPPVTHSRKKEFRLIRPLVYVTEDLTRAYAGQTAAPVIPCGCSLKTGTVRKSLRGMFAELEQDYPFLKQTLLTAMGNLETSRLLDLRYLDVEQTEADRAVGVAFPMLEEEAFIDG